MFIILLLLLYVEDAPMVTRRVPPLSGFLRYRRVASAPTESGKAVPTEGFTFDSKQYSETNITTIVLHTNAISRNWGHRQTDVR